ncbi:hypothetical protein [Streptomyces sp. NPDC002491]
MRSFVNWWRSVDWGKWGTITGIFVGATGLILTALATYYDARVASATLAQSKEDAEKEEKIQASLVNYWTDDKGLMHVVNRSADPVTEALIYVSVMQADLTPNYRDPKWKFWNQSGLYAVIIGTIEPCSRMSISAKDITEGFASDSAPIEEPVNSSTSIGMVSFVDSGGVTWVRTGGQIIKKPEGTDKIFLKMSKEHHAKTAMLKNRRADETIKSCADTVK